MASTSLTAIELNKANCEIAMEVQSLCRRIIEMARVIEEAADAMTADSEFRRVMVCAQVVFETADLAADAIERIETASFTIGEALKKEPAS